MHNFIDGIVKGLDKIVSPQSQWDHTKIADERAERKNIALTFPSLGRDTPIDRHEYIGTQRERVVIDTASDPDLRAFADDFIVRVTREINRGGETRQFLLPLAYELVNTEIPTNSQLAADVGSRFADMPVPLGFFVKNGGVCRHKNLALGLLLEIAKQNQWVSGKVSVDRATTERGSHAWVRYTNSAGEVAILDTLLQRQPIKLRDVDQDIKNGKEVKFDYRRPEDKNPVKRALHIALGIKWRS